MTDGAQNLQAEVATRFRDADKEASFTKPWELRAFALAVAAHDSGRYEWAEFQQSLIESIGNEEKQSPDAGDAYASRYYQHWVEAFEAVLEEHGIATSSEIDDRTTQMLAIPRDANHHHARTEPVAVEAAARP